MSEAYVLGDWGTTNLRLFLYADGRQLDRLDGPGIGSLEQPASQVLAERLSIWKAQGTIASVTLCGMAGARGGLVEAAHLACPAGFADWRGHASRLTVDGVEVAVLSGLRQGGGGHVPDVMRGEETQIFGAISLDPTLGTGSHVLLLPGTHSKWVRVEDGIVRSFRTCPTGELFSLLTTRSTLIAPGNNGVGGFDEGFTRGLIRSGESLTAALFEARAAQLLDKRSQEWARGYMSGLLIGSEVASQIEGAGNVTIIGAPTLRALYGRALDRAGCNHSDVDGDAAVLAGLHLAKENSQ